ncbi:MAG TPA: SRPBCC family protein [Solirubrobacteraceae bacterium]|nr:SRPBCC family protein [Solirubrobacteraceae bacterium]
MASFTARTTAQAAPEQVLRVLTDPDAIRDWSPIPFDVEGLDGLRLEAGSVARVSGSLAGRRVGFDVEVHAADTGGLELTADGPIGFDVLYQLELVEGGSQVTASVDVHDGSGLTGRLLAKATGALLKGGALEAAAGRIARAAESAPCAMAA